VTPATANHHNSAAANREKQLVGLTSVIAAVFLTTFKLAVGLTTGSLGILSEAAHSALDLVAALMTLFAVRVSGRPADREHTYGHGKVENLSALFETLLLLLTCVWIVYEAIKRLFFEPVAVDASIWAFLVMGLSIVIDLSRSSALSRVAKKYDSQALEADALHFSTDIWSSTVVILGLILVRLSSVLKVPWLAEADAVTAMGVAAIVVYVSVQLGRRTIAELLDAVPPEVPEKMTRAVAAVPGVLKVEQVRVRKSGPEGFADITATVNRAVAFENAHDIAAQIERAVRQVMPGADVVVHLDPAPGDHEAMVTTVRLTATRHGLGAHGIRIYDSPGGRALELHLEVPDTLRLDEAHAQASAFEQELRAALPQIERIVTHIEPAGDTSAVRHATLEDEVRVIQAIQLLPGRVGVACAPHEVTVHHVGGEMSVSFHCDLDPGVTISDAHRLTDRLEQALRGQVPNLNRVVIHVEPAPRNGSEPPAAGDDEDVS
jgi:cation diffusion facilitator family transporter